MDNINTNDRLYTTLCSERTLQTDTNGFFFEFADHVVNFSGLDWLENTFGKLSNDRERIKSLLNDEHVIIYSLKKTMELLRQVFFNFFFIGKRNCLRYIIKCTMHIS